jgi:hypothetical protein
MKFNPKFSSYRSRIAVLAIVLIINAFAAVHEHRPSAFGMVILAVAATLGAILPESPGKTKAENYQLTGSKP